MASRCVFPEHSLNILVLSSAQTDLQMLTTTLPGAHDGNTQKDDALSTGQLRGLTLASSPPFRKVTKCSQNSVFRVRLSVGSQVTQLRFIFLLKDVSQFHPKGFLSSKMNLMTRIFFLPLFLDVVYHHLITDLSSASLCVTLTNSIPLFIPPIRTKT